MFAQDASTEARYKAITDSSGRVRLIKGTDGEDLLLVNRVLNKSASVEKIYHKDNQNIKAITYDNALRPKATVTWFGTSTQSSVQEEKHFFYNDLKRRASKTEEFFFTSNIMKRTGYNDKGLVAAESWYLIDKNGNASNRPYASAMNEYDEKDRVVLYQFVTVGKPLQKKVYSYGANGECDEEHYENNALVYSKQHFGKKADAKKASYEETVYFTDGTAVTSVYQDGVKKQEKILVDGKVIREKNL